MEHSRNLLVDPAYKTAAPPPAPSGARERIMAAAYELFAQRGIRDVGIAELISRAGVAKATFYSHFASKDDLALAFLERCHQVWTVEQIISESRRRADDPTAQLLAIFDVLDGWFRRDDFEACSFINTMLEMGTTHPLGKAAAGYLAQTREFMRTLATEAGLEDPDRFARSCHILTKGSIISAVEGDKEAAIWAKRMALSLIAEHGGEAPLTQPTQGTS
ncbi:MULTISPECIES: TetR/AcrR family transcriptional regulator [unclassified Arthrobacter]|uniref:TetR/AcrR family transcriptional regulator n=1 Tax=unclassified Arthrobacter TaxID=235627 RepID=UPI002DFC798E|nr:MULTISPECIES: helix-turn-helix domain-containing protein [unclassified Arthrobacter]MEC5193529.1 AcrR family transcriptional regulator [Arthrobacter sp. MP_M4]MEC5205004.1 AcrR family transcriptional regulator [Arthrobacter sp. MP_M7]